MVADEPAAPVGEDGRPGAKTRPVLLAAAGRDPSDAAPVWWHGAADRGAAGGRRVGTDFHSKRMDGRRDGR